MNALYLITLFSLGIMVETDDLVPDLRMETTLFEKNQTTLVYIDKNEQAVVYSAFDMLQNDVSTVFDAKLQLTDDQNKAQIIISSSKELQGKWETFQIDIQNHKLYIAGSDARGKAYGILELSRMVGISPWEWWADVTPEKQTKFSLPNNYVNQQSPSVQYRGIFLNDEDWALMPWSTRTFEPTPVRGAIGPKTYSKIFELMLRLRTNTIWPAMHECSVPFFMVDGNREAAEKYGIVLSTSHAEPMMRTNTGEWNNREFGEFNFLTNRDRILSYWEDRVKQLTRTENIYTVGMRGIHDGRMQGVSSIDDETKILHTIIEEQRNMFRRNYPDRDLTTIPQIFVPYKEVLKAYDNGLKLPDDITLVWCDDNQGHIMRLSNPEEKKRSGGSGVYYHVSYWGKPHDYLWLGSTQPGLIYAEMKRAYDYGARKLWILNVGDIKPNEYLTEFFFDMAWNIDSFKGNTIYKHRENWVNRTFNSIESKKINHIIEQYYLLAGHRKPEHMAWNRVEDLAIITSGGLQPVKDTDLSPFVFGDEMEKRIDAYDAIAQQSKEVYEKISQQLQPAYFQLVHYPIIASGAINRKILYAQKARIYAETNPDAARTYSDLATQAYNEIAALDYFFNKDMLNGKWELMMDMKPRDLPVFQLPVLPSLSDGKRACLDDLPVTGSFIPPENPYHESDRMIALNASQHTNRANFEMIDGLGHSGNAVRLPQANKLNNSSPFLEFRITTTSIGAAKIKLGTIPWHPANGDELRCAIVVDKQKPQYIVINAEFLTEKWAENVLRNQALNSINVHFDAAGEHFIRIYAIDEEVLVDQIMIDFESDRKHYLIPVR